MHEGHVAWQDWLQKSLVVLEKDKLLRSLRLIRVQKMPFLGEEKEETRERNGKDQFSGDEKLILRECGDEQQLKNVEDQQFFEKDREFLEKGRQMYRNDDQIMENDRILSLEQVDSRLEGEEEFRVSEDGGYEEIMKLTRGKMGVDFGDEKYWNGIGSEIEVSESTLNSWLEDRTSPGEQISHLSSKKKKIRLFSGNDYLGLASHPAIRAAAAKAVLEYGMGPRASPLVCGYTQFHRKLETQLADLCSTEECLLCPTGFAANMAIITAITGGIEKDKTTKDKISNDQISEDKNLQSGSEKISEVNLQNNEIEIFSDEFNHASIIDGIRISTRQKKVVLSVYRHCDMTHLEELLLKSSAKRKLVVTDSLFSMDGDFAPMRELANLRRVYGFLLLVDEAHCTLVCGERGGGATEAFGVEGEVDFHVGTLSKAVGCQGGFVACSRSWKQWLLSRGRSFIYSTAIPIPVVAAASASLTVARVERWRRERVWRNVRHLGALLGVRFASPICAIVLGGAEETMGVSRDLLLKGFHVGAIRPPTVPLNSSRLRIALSSSHSIEDLNLLVAALPENLKTRGLLLTPLGKNPITWYPKSFYENNKYGIENDKFRIRKGKSRMEKDKYEREGVQLSLEVNRPFRLTDIISKL